MFFVGVVSIFGFAIGIRTAEHWLARHLIARDEMTKIGTLYVFMLLALLFTLPRSRVSTWFAVFAPLLMIVGMIVLLIQKRAADFRDALGAILTLVSLKMKGGRSFRQSLSEVIAESAPKMRAKLSEIASAVVFSQQKTGERLRDANEFVNEVIEELIRIDRQPHAASKRLTVFRDKLRMEDDFRRRSGQVLARLRAQSLVMTGLYVALAAFIAVKFGWRENIRFFAYSALLFIIGAVWIWRGGRNLKWKV